MLVFINEQGFLDDIVKSGTDAWKKGTLANYNFKAVIDSPITCVYNPGATPGKSDDLFKVFYYKSDTAAAQNAPWVAWWNNEKWQTEAVISTQ